MVTKRSKSKMLYILWIVRYTNKVRSKVPDINDIGMMDCIKLLDNMNPEFTLLSKDETSMVAQISDLYTESINVFYVPEKDEKFDENAIRITLRDALDE